MCRRRGLERTKPAGWEPVGGSLRRGTEHPRDKTLLEWNGWMHTNTWLRNAAGPSALSKGSPKRVRAREWELRVSNPWEGGQRLPLGPPHHVFKCVPEGGHEPSTQAGRRPGSAALGRPTAVSACVQGYPGATSRTEKAQRQARAWWSQGHVCGASGPGEAEPHISWNPHEEPRAESALSQG